jgi:hypothetical protein
MLPTLKTQRACRRLTWQEKKGLPNVHENPQRQLTLRAYYEQTLGRTVDGLLRNSQDVRELASKLAMQLRELSDNGKIHDF